MKPYRILFSMLSVAVLMTSCQKQPTASFKTDKSVYVAGETIKLTSTSTDASNYKWTMPDGQTSATKDVDYTLNVNDQSQSLLFKLEVSSKNDKKKDEATQTVIENAATGNIVFWQIAGSGFGTTTVQLNGFSSDITLDMTSVPSCGESGCATFNSVKVGFYNYTATDGSTTWSGTVQIQKNQCKTMQLY